MAPGRRPPAERERRAAGLIGNELDADRARYGAPVVGGHRQIEKLSAVTGQQVAMPGEPGNRIASPHQEAVAGVIRIARVVGPRSVVEELQATLVAPVGPIEEEPPVALGHVDRLQQQEVTGEVHEPARIPRRLDEVDNVRLRLACGIDGEAHPTGDPLIRAGGLEVLTAGEWLALEHRKHQ